MGAENEVEVTVVEEVFVDGQLAELVVIEEFAKRGEKPPHAKTYVIRIDKETYHVHKHNPTGEELLHLAGKSSATYKLYQVFRGRQPEPVAPHEHVDLRAHGIERFTTVPKDPKEGASATEAPRRDFQLASHDVEYLDALGLPWETIRDPAGVLLLAISGWKLPAGYNVHTAQIALVIPQGYPDTQIDMAFFLPGLARSDGKAINNLSFVNWTFGRFQQWSRHRTPAHPWRSGIDDVSTHLSLVDDWLRREFDLR
jgi:Prokaryotic E2 family E/Multiubiquitin